ncbi:MAG: 30S ribosomal protein S4 [Nitrospirae bacterium RIFCSPLOW2_12_42_9]|uniref:Small ribosomal subunit protein uS4 n=1 Tax=uncultured Nitrospirae bacterium Rifle_16ft_4_minimus_4901 TaxID=1665132 RepID=A0A0H4TCS3_9BACT|nr:30S ribosomal protein S4, small subunit ribosomal protein S4 [uncultured Nitrospirae bacterium Rifle_16ft_4_minimus_4901]OGW15907.1 MAG: 30S ribosomal protein S4 [Nitrospirae bacterium GWA2_42_11]OGW58466.1 MAG: 30S ribosomal protein S4 [Nitrospirae bacterium RIFCSPLOW2_12_42_9]OGW58900.1 MAG: 30S ribosomal protein S4 [Nitrospirae bacterium RIFCSPHIGHO2_02_FULL_42_12]HBI22919.1 30S ribosomal protein S4 [Nitrospiraceae bacterium]
MARYIGPVCRICRRAGMKLILKGNRCLTEKCAFERRGYPPGLHGQPSRSPKPTEYSVQLREKQKVKQIYGLLERQFRGYFRKASKKKGITGEILLQMLERRLDNVVYKAGFARSGREARQMVRHGHFTVNGKRVNLPSYLIKEGQTIEVLDRCREIPMIKEAMENIENKIIPSWIEVEKDNFRAKVVGLPTREEISLPISEQLIVELYSK